MNLLKKLIFLTSVFFLSSACHRPHTEKQLEAKIFHYEVQYVDEKAGAIPTAILPNRMTLIFTPNMAKNSIEGFLGQFSLHYIADLRKEKVTTLLNIFDKYYYYEGKKGELPVGIKSLEGMKLIKTSEIRNFINFRAEQHLLEIPGRGNTEIWSTKDITIKNPNITTPYKNLDGVLLQFYAELSVLKMSILVSKYEENQISAREFSIPGEYKKVSKIKLEKTLEELFK